MKRAIYLFVITILVVNLYSCRNTDVQFPDLTQYNIDMVFDPAQLVLNCKMNVKWRNNSKGEVLEIPFHFNSDSAKTLIKNVTVNGLQSDIKYKSKNDEGFEGFVIKLNTPVEADEQVDIDLDFATQKNEYFRDKILLFQNDLPLMPYFENGKFIPHYQVHSNYNVKITYPDDFGIAATGSIKDTTFQNNLITIRTAAKEVPFYGIVLFKEVNIAEAITNNVLVRSFYFNDDEKWGMKFLDYSKDIIQFYKDTLGFYPQPVLNIIPGYAKPYGGWPVCPNIVGIHRGIDTKKDQAEIHANWIMAHEIGHQYWGFNYVLESLDYPQWFGISMGIYTDRMYSIKRGLNKDYSNFTARYVKGVSQGYNTTIMQKTDSLDKQGFDWNNVIKHGKSFAVIRMLAHEVGENTFFKIFKYCLDSYKGVNVTIEMFKNDCERISNKNLYEFFQTWFYTNDYLEYQIIDVRVNQTNGQYVTGVKINRTGKAKIPEVDISFVLENGEIIEQKFDGRLVDNILSIKTGSPVKEVILDPGFKLPLINKNNWTKNNLEHYSK